MNSDRVLAAPGLIILFDDDGLRLEHPAWDYAVRAAPAVVEVLHLACRPVERQALIRAFAIGGDSTAEESVQRLLNLNVLHAAGNDTETRSRVPAPWRYWGSLAWLFHERAQQTVFLHEESDIWFEKARREEPSPERILKYKSTDGALDLSIYRGANDLAAILARRRTTRQFSPEVVPLGPLAQLVSDTFRIRDVCDADFFGLLPKKSYPSSGGRHELDIYVVCLHVGGVGSGIYYYDDAADRLVPTELNLDRPMLESALGHQGIVQSAAAVVISVCRPELIAWKYRSPRGYLDTYVNTGHAMQNAVLVAEDLGLGAWLTTATQTALLKECLALDFSEFATAALALGWPRDTGEPVS